MDWKNYIMTAGNLDVLCERLNDYENEKLTEDEITDVDLSYLPNFGDTNTDPTDAELTAIGIFSWDDYNLLVQGINPPWVLIRRNFPPRTIDAKAEA